MKIKLDDTMYDTPEDGDRPLTLGEQSLLKREYGFVAGKGELDLLDPDHLGAFLFQVLRKKFPDAPQSMLVKQIADARKVLVNDDGSPITDEQADEKAEEHEREKLDPQSPLTRPPSDSESVGESVTASK